MTIPDAPCAEDRQKFVVAEVRRVVTHSDKACDDLRRAWPLGMPTIKSGHRFTNAQVDELVKILARVEGENEMPFGQTDPERFRADERAETIIRQAFPGTIKVDDSQSVSDEVLDELRNALDSLSDERKTLIASITKQANAAKLDLSLRRCPSKRREQIARALIDVSMFEDLDVVRALVELVANNVPKDATLGRIFGGLRIEQAEALQKIAHALHGGLLTLEFKDDGFPVVRGDVQSIVGCTK